jgi:hypothetical protein
MSVLSINVKKVLVTLGKDHLVYVTPVSKSMGSILVGDLVAFTYLPDDSKRYDLGQRLAVVVLPVMRDGKSGKLLLTVVKVPLSGSFTPTSVEQLYKDSKAKDSGSYRTYLMPNILGHVYKIDTKERNN